MRDLTCFSEPSQYRHQKVPTARREPGLGRMRGSLAPCDAPSRNDAEMPGSAPRTASRACSTPLRARGAGTVGGSIESISRCSCGGSARRRVANGAGCCDGCSPVRRAYPIRPRIEIPVRFRRSPHRARSLPRRWGQVDGSRSSAPWVSPVREAWPARGRPPHGDDHLRDAQRYA